MRSTIALSTLVSTFCLAALVGFAPTAQANPDEPENTNLDELVDEDGGGEPESQNYKSPVVPSPAECLTMAEYATMTQYNNYSVDVWGLHALAWAAHMNPLTSYTPPGPNISPAPPTGRPSTAKAANLGLLEADTSVFTSDPDGMWTSRGSNDLNETLAIVALAVNRYQSPVYLEIGPLNGKQVGDPEVFVVERLSVATAGADFGSSCLFDSASAATDCINDINHWWTIGEVEGMVYFKGGGHMRVTLLGPDFTDLVDQATFPWYSNLIVYNLPSSPGYIGAWNDTIKALGLRYYVATVQGCPDIAVGDEGNFE